MLLKHTQVLGSRGLSFSLRKPVWSPYVYPYVLNVKTEWDIIIIIIIII